MAVVPGRTGRVDPEVHVLRTTCLVLIAVLSMARLGLADGPVVADLILKGGTVIDGTGAPGRRADVALRGDRIVAVGELDVAPGAKVVDVTGRVVAPGFIDLHSHSDGVILNARNRANYNYQTQGVTTVVTGN